MRDLTEIKQIVRDNSIAGRDSYDGLTSSEIGQYNRALMFGDNNEAMPDPTEWSRIVD